MKNLTTLEKILLSVLGVMLTAWLGWLTTTVVSLADKAREDTAQWEKMRRLEERINKFHDRH